MADEIIEPYSIINTRTISTDTVVHQGDSTIQFILPKTLENSITVSTNNYVHFGTQYYILPETVTPTTETTNEIYSWIWTGLNYTMRNRTVIIHPQHSPGLASVPAMKAEIGETVKINKTVCDDIATTGTGSVPNTTRQRQPGLDPGYERCTTDKGDDMIIHCPGYDGDGIPGEPCITEDDNADEKCIRYLNTNQYNATMCRESTDNIGGIAGGVYYKWDSTTGGGPIWVFPDGTTTLYIDASVSEESATSTEELWGLGRGLPMCKLSKDELGCDYCGCLNFLYGVLWRPTCTSYARDPYKDPETGETILPFHDGDTWQKYQFWYPNGGIWIWILKGNPGYGGPVRTQDADVAGHINGTEPWSKSTSGGYVGWTDLMGAPYSTINAPTIVMGSSCGDEENKKRDPTQGGQLPPTKFKDTQGCMDDPEMKALYPDLWDRTLACQVVMKNQQSQTSSTEGWSACMLRVVRAVPTITEEQASTICNNHPDWSDCMIQAYAEGLSEEEAEERCEGEPITHCTYEVAFVNQPYPYPIYAIMLYVGGTACCPWGIPGIQLWRSMPASSIDGLRVCEPDMNELDNTLSDRMEDQDPNTMDK